VNCETLFQIIGLEGRLTAMRRARNAYRTRLLRPVFSSSHHCSEIISDAAPKAPRFCLTKSALPEKMEPHFESEYQGSRLHLGFRCWGGPSRLFAHFDTGLLAPSMFDTAQARSVTRQFFEIPSLRF
jgi:hypothetical protein